jgi:pimeloyl-ACP methyl ester carboxylesterase
MSSSDSDPFWLEAGAGPSVVCLHANASQSSQWRALMDLLGDRRRMLAVDGYGAGQSPEWPSDRVISLADEARLIEPVLARAGPRFALVGHSHGGALALHVARHRPGQIGALVLFEPTLFALIEADGPSPNDADGLQRAVAAAAQALDADDEDGAARAFIDYWSGPGAWDQTPPKRRPVLARSIRNVRRWAHALLTEPMPLPALTMPVLLMTGGMSTVAAHGVARRLMRDLPNVTHRAFPALGHMGPITHPEVVNAEIERFLMAHP